MLMSAFGATADVPIQGRYVRECPKGGRGNFLRRESFSSRGNGLLPIDGRDLYQRIPISGQ